ncbi:glycosyltransferase [Shewanella sp. 1CM18E]|uniref:glycosyltransferase n=1 Tax=Shewanella sp. 1CM18E TaxID=2929169 RepID=UPI0020BEE10F|nr:glycosyltransferase [Shewanella sp. 1CM18E]MCK8045324.1 glycosyltransferase [Shewanella sp. 1CM18E]
MNTPVIAAIIATKNRPNLLKKRAIKSVFNQSRLPNILVVVDDSLGQVQQQNKFIIESLPSNHCHIQYLKNRRTPGASGAWNTAIDYLTGQYQNSFSSLFLAFLDDDDEWHSSYLESCLDTASLNNSNMVATGMYRYECSGLDPIKCLPPTSLNEDIFLRGNPGIQGSNLFLSLDVMLLSGCFDEHLSSCTDRDLCIRLCELDGLSYYSLNEPLLNHYADIGRERLSTPSSPEKLNGLTAFWLKYHGRMNDEQRVAFVTRAQKLFNWSLPKSHQALVEPALQVALTLGIELGHVSFGLITETIAKLIELGSQHLVGLNIVLTKGSELYDTDLSTLLDFISQQSITCYNLCEKDISIEIATAKIAKENIGHSAWVLSGRPFFDRSIDTFENVIFTFLTEVGARQLCTHFINEQVEQNTELASELILCRTSQAHTRIQKLLNVEKLQLLGVGSEAVVMTDGKRVFKCIDYWKTRIPEEQINFLKLESSKWHNLPGLYALDNVLSDGKALVLTYPYEESRPYEGGYCEQVVNLIHSCSKAGIVCNNIHPKNLIKTFNEVKLIDYGSDIRPWNELGFEHMARRAFLSINFSNHPRLKYLMRQSLQTLNLNEMQGYQQFRQRLIGIDCNLKLARQVKLPLPSLTERPSAFELIIGVITSDPYKLLPLLCSISDLVPCGFITRIKTIVLCNDCSANSLEKVLVNSPRPTGNVQIISEEQQVIDAESGLFGACFTNRPNRQIGIAHARSMLQKYVGLECAANPNTIAWILDDDMRLDGRAQQYLGWLPKLKEEGVDIAIGQYEGSSPNPPLNGLRGQLVDLLHNLRWLDKLPIHAEIPDRSAENTKLRNKYPDYYYDLSRKHSAHLEVPFWLEPAYKGESVKEARTRLCTYAPLLLTGFPLTRSIVPVCSEQALVQAKDTVNRGGNTFVLNPKALTSTPNLIPEINEREARRSDMVWAVINKYHHGLNIKAVPFPVQHSGRVSNRQVLNIDKVQDEIMGSALYAGLLEFLATNEQHNLVFTTDEKSIVWKATQNARNTRLARLKLSFHRINGIAQALSKYPELSELCKNLTCSFSPSNFAKLEVQVNQMNKQHIHEFLNKIVPQSTAFASAHNKMVETIEHHAL